MPHQCGELSLELCFYPDSMGLVGLMSIQGQYEKHLEAITAAKQKALEKAAAKAIQEAAATIEK